MHHKHYNSVAKEDRFFPSNDRPGKDQMTTWNLHVGMSELSLTFSPTKV